MSLIINSFCFNLFVIDSLPLVARDFRKRILPFWVEELYPHENLEIVLKITHFNVLT